MYTPWVATRLGAAGPVRPLSHMCDGTATLPTEGSPQPSLAPPGLQPRGPRTSNGSTEPPARAGPNLPATVGDYLSSHFKTNWDWLGTTRARVGFVVTPDNRLMIFGTGGVAYGGGSVSGGVIANYYNSSTVPNSIYTWNGSSDFTRVGWTVGGGAELAVTNNVLIRAEYLYYNLGSSNVNAYEFNDPSNGVYLQTKENVDGSVVRIGVDYKF